MEERELVVRADEIVPFSLPGEEDVYSSQCIIDTDGVGSSDLLVNRFVLRAHKSLKGGTHPENDEAYYVLHGRSRLHIGGRAEDGSGGKTYEIGPDTAIFIPAGTYHRLENNSDEDLVLLTMWPRLPRLKGNRLYDTRRQLWGTSFQRMKRAGDSF